MMTNTIILNSLPLAVLFLAVVMTIFLLVFGRLLSRYLEITKEKERYKSSLFKEEAEILEKAQLKAREIITEALKNSVLIDKRTQDFQKQIREFLDIESSEIVLSYAEKLKTASDKALQTYQNSLDRQIEENTKRLNDFSKTIEKETILAMQNEVEKQKQEKLNRLSEKIYEITQTATGEIINKSLKLEDHEDLVMEALERAKRNLI